MWTSLSRSRRRFILLAVVSGFGLIVLTSTWWAVEILGGAPAGDGILFPPMVLSVAAYAGLVGISVLVAARSVQGDPDLQGLARLGSIWMLASIPLNFDYLVDSFPAKLLVNVLFVVVAIRCWKGVRNSYLSLFLAPLTILIAAADGIGHLQGSFCSGTALDACPAKAVSDFYLVMLIVGVAAATVLGRTQRPDPVKLAAAVAVIVLIALGLALAPF